MIAKKPELAKRFLRAVKRSFEWARDNPEEACKAARPEACPRSRSTTAWAA